MTDHLSPAAQSVMIAGTLSQEISSPCLVLGGDRAAHAGFDLSHLGDELVGDVSLDGGEAQQLSGDGAQFVNVGRGLDVARLFLDLELIREGEVEVQPEHGRTCKGSLQRKSGASGDLLQLAPDATASVQLH